MKDPDRLPDRLAEFGRFEESRKTYNGRNPENPVDQETYLKKNTRKYPELTRSNTQAQEEIKRERENTRTRPSSWEPPKDPLPPGNRPDRQRKPDQKQEKPATPRDKQEERPRTEVKKTPSEGKAEDYHRRQWDDSKRQDTRRDQTQAPRQQQWKETAPKPKPQKTITPPRNSSKPQKTGGRKNQ